MNNKAIPVYNPASYDSYSPPLENSTDISFFLCIDAQKQTRRGEKKAKAKII